MITSELFEIFVTQEMQYHRIVEGIQLELEKKNRF
jgi:hypothetical protein